MHVFFEASFNAADQTHDREVWRDVSSTEHFVFASGFGVVRLRKRTSYPATFAYAQGSRLYFGYGDADRGYDLLSRQLGQVPEDAFYDTEFLFGVADFRSKTVTLQRDTLGILPLFLMGNKEQLVLSNEYDRVIAGSPNTSWHTNDWALGDFLLGNLNSQPLLQEMTLLSDRQRATWCPGEGLVRTYPTPGSFAELSEDREASGKPFWDKLEGTLERYWQRYGTRNSMAAELSGGLDSSLINGYHASKGRSYLMTTLVHPGKHTATQEKKLTDFTQRFGGWTQPIPLDETTDYPLASMRQSGTWQPFFHLQELYTASVRKQARFMADHGVTAVFRGIGGNELGDNWADQKLLPNETALEYFLRTSPDVPVYVTNVCIERYKHALQGAPPPIMPLMALQIATATAGSNNLYIEQGIWPVMPLADPQLYLYCQTLPIRYRANRNIIRAYMQARGFPPSIYKPVSRENFSDFFRSCSTRLTPFLQEALEQSVLAEAGLIDTQKALALWHANEGKPFDPKDRDPLFSLYCLLVAEINLQATGARLS